MIGPEMLRIAWSGITANKLRSGLTILGMTIGVASVIVLIAVGNGSSKAVQSTIQSLGTNVLVVQASGGFRFGARASTAATRVADQAGRRSAAEPEPRPRRQERLAGRRRQRRQTRLRRHELRTVVVHRHDPLLPDRPHATSSRKARRSPPKTSASTAAWR